MKVKRKEDMLGKPVRHKSMGVSLSNRVTRSKTYPRMGMGFSRKSCD